MPMTYPPGAKNTTAQLGGNIFVTEDGTNLPFRHWLPETAPHAIIIALHGFNDYSHFFQQPGEYFSKLGIASFAYDQRGFGAAPKRGLWAGGEAYTHDLHTLVQLVKQRYPDLPVYLLGESMGGAIIITAMSQTNMPGVDGIILVAPALWARSTMPWYQTSLLWTLAHSMPWLTLTGKGVKVMPSDNIEMLRALGRDPWVIKATRVETVYGLTNLMDEAFNSAPLLHANTLMLYGEKDEIIPKKPTYAFLQKFLATDTTDKTVAFYQQGYHMLLRDLQAPTAWKDIAEWINNKPEKLPSGADNRAKEVLARYIPETTKEEN
ncbi:MAG: lysophospholipase [Methylococcales bacterium]|nr:lysophospholipase [Methylococcales bacterium]